MPGVPKLTAATRTTKISRARVVLKENGTFVGLPLPIHVVLSTRLVVSTF